MDLTPFDAVLFDLDGVLTPTAALHMRAWEQTFTAFLAAHGVAAPYTDDDYFAHVDGKPRYDGVRDFLFSRGLHLPEGTSSDSPDTETVRGLGNRKNEDFNFVLAREGIAPYPGAVRLLDTLAGRGTGTAVVSSSKNSRRVLEAAGLLERFAVIVDGVTAARLGLPGKPDPATFLHAAQQLGAPAARAVVVEDAVSGVAAGRAGNFGLVVGVDRGAGEAALRDAGADVVVRELEELL